MKKSALILLTILLQSCYSYKEISLAEMEKNKTYQLKLKNAKKAIEFNYATTPTITDSLFIEKKGKVYGISVNQIESIKKRKISAIPTIGVAVLSTVGIVWYANRLSNEETLSERISPN